MLWASREIWAGIPVDISVNQMTLHQQSNDQDYKPEWTILQSPLCGSCETGRFCG